MKYIDSTDYFSAFCNESLNNPSAKALWATCDLCKPINSWDNIIALCMKGITYDSNFILKSTSHILFYLFCIIWRRAGNVKRGRRSSYKVENYVEMWRRCGAAEFICFTAHIIPLNYLIHLPLLGPCPTECDLGRSFKSLGLKSKFTQYSNRIHVSG